MAKSASFFSANSFTCRGVITCSASALRSSGLSGGTSRLSSSPFTRTVGGRPTLRSRSDAFRCTIWPMVFLKLNDEPAAETPVDGVLSHWDRPGRGPGRTPPAAASSTHTSRITPVISASISFMIFIASMMQTVWPEVTRLPTFTYDSAPGSGAL